MPFATRSPRFHRAQLVGALASALVAASACGGDDPSGLKSYSGVDGEYTIEGRPDPDDFIARTARLSGRVTLRQPDPKSSTLTGTAAVTLFNGNTAVETYTEVFRAEREGERGFRFLLTTDAGLSGSWEFVGTVDDGRVSGRHYLDLYRNPATGGISYMEGTWSGTR